MGVEHYVRPPFEEFCTLSPEAFVHDVLAVRFGAKAVFCGDNFTFGSRKAGNVDMLRRLCAAAGISVEIVPMVQREGAPVSSSRIRACLEAGDVETAGAMLGEPYCIDLPVRHGKRLGTALGFPTINQIYPDWMLLPRQGVYVTRVLLDGVWRPQCYGLGHAPHGGTATAFTCETFIPEFFRRYLRRQSAGALLPIFVAYAEIRYAGGGFRPVAGPRRAGRAGVAGEMSLRCYKPHKTWQNALFLRVRCVILFRLPYYGLQAYPGPVSGASLDGLPTLRLRQIIKKRRKKPWQNKQDIIASARVHETDTGCPRGSGRAAHRAHQPPE